MQRTLSILKALSDRNRLRVVAALMHHNELCACQITELLEIRGATVSRHMALLTGAGLIESQKEGRWVFYRLSSNFKASKKLFEWLTRELQQNPELDADEERLQKIVALDPEELCRRQRGTACCPEKEKIS